MSRFELKIFNFRVSLPFPKKGTIEFCAGTHEVWVPVRIRKRHHVYYYMETPKGHHGCGHARGENELFEVVERENGFFVKIHVESEWLKFHWYVR
jgi:hypothetical protein